jgi:hypothetical protein
MNFFKNTFPVLLFLLLPLALSSCRTGDNDLQANTGRKVNIVGDLVKGPSGYMIFRNAELDSVYLMPLPGADGKTVESDKFKDFVIKNDGRKISVTGKLLFRRIDPVNKFPEETEKAPTEYYLIYWDAKDTQIEIK